MLPICMQTGLTYMVLVGRSMTDMENAMKHSWRIYAYSSGYLRILGVYDKPAGGWVPLLAAGWPGHR